MRTKIIQALLMISCCVFLLSACSQRAVTYDSYGRPIYMSNYRGKWVLINYWAKWCKPCLKELPDLNRLYLTHKDRVMVLGVSFDLLTRQRINEFAKQYHIKFPMLADFPLTTIGAKEVGVIPVTFVINPKGQLVKVLHGPQTMHSLERAIGI